ncbi:hypothetical protein [Candidatus Hecatella orcuttiae]|jgi:ribosomal protein S25|uniref:hypothetical protein n=1 Tax=Candidatus Hecatella orcuttiae TaxID=1935119 RepID=UPI0028680DF6|nr:hypothetical protein [Candidatus Hecatella orcuttiae]
MGGGKKKGLSAMEKAQRLKEEKEKAGRKKGKPAPSKKVSITYGFPEVDDETLTSELGKMKAVTPAALASAFNIKVSMAEDYLESLQKRGLVSLVRGCERLKIYKPTAAS